MNMNELSCWLALWRLPGAGPAQFQTVIDQLGGIPPLFQRSAVEWQAWGFDQEQTRLLAEFAGGQRAGLAAGVQQDLDWLQQGDDHHILTWQHPDYPPLLRQIRGAPPVLFVRGQPGCLALPQIAIVGSRHCSRDGKALAHQFASHFSRNGFITTSGLALGIDAAAHAGALESGRTIAVLAHGLDSLFPVRNRSLGEQVAASGALVSEFPIGVQPRPEFFPRRNRIISGLSLGVLVVEAAVKSGSLITANVAADQGREVFAIPGSIHNPLAKGCHALIRNGARLVESADQVVEELLPLLGYLRQQVLFEDGMTAQQEAPAFADGSAEQRVLVALEYTPCPVDQIVLLTGLPVAEVNSALVLLELDGVIRQQQGGYCRV
jgi:DNA processing protein